MPTQDSLITTTLSFDRATYKALKILAVDSECTVRDLVRIAVKDFLKKRGKS
jgi:hypothetical protein